MAKRTRKRSSGKGRAGGVRLGYKRFRRTAPKPISKSAARRISAPDVESGALTRPAAPFLQPLPIECGACKGRRGPRSLLRRSSPGCEGRKPDTEAELRERLERVRRALYGLYGDLRYFTACPPAHRARLREEIDWPDVGHITSLARSLAEEERFADWVRFNRVVTKVRFHGKVRTVPGKSA